MCTTWMHMLLDGMWMSDKMLLHEQQAINKVISFAWTLCTPIVNCVSIHLSKSTIKFSSNSNSIYSGVCAHSGWIIIWSFIQCVWHLSHGHCGLTTPVQVTLLHLVGF